MTISRTSVLAFALAAPLLMGGQEPGKTGHLDDLIPVSDPRAAPLLAARTALDAGDVAGALGQLAREIPPLEDYRALLIAGARAKEGKAEEALKALGSIRARPAACEAEPELFIRAQTLAADLLADVDPKAAAARLLSLPPDDGPRLARAIALLTRAKDDDGVARTERLLLLEAAETFESRELAKKLGPSKVIARLTGIDERMKRIRVLLDRHRNQEAVKEARALSEEVGGDHPLACELAYIEGKAYRKLRNYRGAIGTLRGARTRCEAQGNIDLAERSALLEAQVLGIRGAWKETKKIADWFMKAHKDHSFADDALLVHAGVLQQVGKAKEAEKIFQRIIDEMPNSDTSPEAAWQLALDAMVAEKHARASELLAWILERSQVRPIDRARARFWRAILLDQSKHEEEAIALYRAVVMEPSFYAWLALDRLNRRKPKVGEALRRELVQLVEHHADDVPLPDRLIGTDEFARARLLFAAGEPELARSELQRLTCLELAKDEVLALALAFDRIGAHPEAQLLLRTRAEAFLAKPIEAADVPIFRLAYSRPYFDLVESAAGAEKVEPLFLLALVREESTFDPEIVSWAGATGLAQLMPATAIGAYADVYKKRLTDLERLTDPELNLRLGAHVLKDGLSRWKHTEALALSAYNGGNGLTKKILPSSTIPFERWVETIPVKETRGYVKRVIETWGIYRLLYDQKSPFIDLPDEISPDAP